MLQAREAAVKGINERITGIVASRFALGDLMASRSTRRVGLLKLSNQVPILSTLGSIQVGANNLVTFKIEKVHVITSQAAQASEGMEGVSRTFDTWFWSEEDEKAPRFQVAISTPSWWTSHILLAAIYYTIKKSG